MSSIFEYSNELLKFHEFIKIASWHIPFVIFSSNSINIINSICSIASFYQVCLEVFENDEIKKEDFNLAQIKDQKNEIKFANSQILQKIHESSHQGNWILLIFYEFPKNLIKLISDLLEALNIENQIKNSFRLILDLQHIKKASILENLLVNNSIIYHMDEENLDEMEGFNDVWANILNDKILPTNIAIRNETNEDFLPTQKSSFSKKFTLNNEVSEISLEEFKNIETEQESLIEKIQIINS